MESNDTHLLIQKEIGLIRDWKTWRQLWDEAKYAEQLVGLLHVAYDVEAYHEAWDERLRFLLHVADGHASEWRHGIQRHALVDSYRLRIAVNHTGKAVAEKAFKVLCDRFFRVKEGLHQDGRTSILDALTERETFETVVWFFCDHERRSHDRNLPKREDDTYTALIAQQYVLEMIEHVWRNDKFPRYGRSEAEDAQLAIFDAARPRLVRLLHDLRRLSFLYEPYRGVDEASLEALRRLAFDEYGQPKYRTAEEAVNTYAGQALLILEAKMRDDERKRLIAAAERKKREAERELEDARK